MIFRLREWRALAPALPAPRPAPRHVVLAAVLAMIPAHAASADPRLPELPKRAAGAATATDADAVFESAQFEMTTGNRSEARRLLNALLSRYPDTKHAVAARAMLRQLAPPQREWEQRSALGLPGQLVGPAPGSGDAIAPGGWQTSVKVARTPQEDLAETSGDRIFFAPGSAALGSHARRVLAAQAKWLAENKAYGLEISGHADETGSDALNRDVSRRRALAVRNRLVAEGVDKRRLKVTSYGRRQRVAICDFAACTAQNRRVVSAVRRWSPRGGLSSVGERATN